MGNGCLFVFLFFLLTAGLGYNGGWGETEER